MIHMVETEAARVPYHGFANDILADEIRSLSLIRSLITGEDIPPQMVLIVITVRVPHRNADGSAMRFIQSPNRCSVAMHRFVQRWRYYPMVLPIARRVSKASVHCTNMDFMRHVLLPYNGVGSVTTDSINAPRQNTAVMTA